MSKIKEWFKTLGAKLKNFPKGQQSKAFVRIVQFFALMLVLTIFARGAAGVTMPEVQAAAPGQQQIRNADDFSGTVTSANKQDEKLPAGLTVSRVHVSSGSTVAVGDDLVTFDTETLQENLLNAQGVLLSLQQELQQLEESTVVDDTALKAAQRAYDAAKAAYDAAATGVNNANAAVNAAQAALDNVQSNVQAEVDKAYYDLAAQETAVANKVTDTKSDYDTYMAGYTGSDPGGTPPTDDPTAIHLYSLWQSAITAQTDWQTAFNEAQANLGKVAEIVAARKPQLQSALSDAKSTQATANSSLASAKDALTAAEEALHKAQQEYNEAKEDSALAEQLRQNNIRKKKLEIQKQQQVVADVNKIMGTGGTVRATVAGTVTQVTVAQSGITTEADYVRISTGDEGYVAEFSVSQEKARDIRLGNTVSVKTTGSYWGTDARVVGKSIPENGMVTVRAQMSSQQWNDGDAVTVTVVYNDSYYYSCVPISAVRSEGGTSYVLVLREENTILGTQTVARKVEVTVAAQDDKYAALDGSFYEYDVKVIVSSTKPVSDGDMVRLGEESTQ
ncbi:hypothetical protein LJC04_04185 [Ruminococcaceae bacterium OttesenSCG-928-O06]|nr:hypothetical protein [Ruminococcaceae bacterium OttesenSCG-928-O06]